MPERFDDDQLSRVLTMTRINAALALWRRKNWRGAAALTRRNGAGAVRPLIHDIETAVGYAILTPESFRGNEVTFTPHGIQLMGLFEQIHLSLAAVRRATDERSLIVVVGLPHHDQMILPLVKEAPSDMRLIEHYLDEHQRASFEDHAVNPLLGGVYDMIIGLPPLTQDRSTEMITEVLYEPRLEAMVPNSYPEKSVPLKELATTHKLLVPPLEFRSRVLFEESISKGDFAAAPASERIRLESHVTKNLIRYGWNNEGTVVLPSDIALAWKKDEDCGGPLAKRFKWLPVLSDGVHLTHKVHGTIRNDHNQQIEQLFEQLKNVVAQRKDKLEGDFFDDMND